MADNKLEKYCAKRNFKAASVLALLPVEDMVATAEQPNVPGADEKDPNWRRRLALLNAARNPEFRQ